MTSDAPSHCVLVVDDEEDIRDTLCEFVEMTGCTALVASNGVEALGILSETRPCLVILDLLMPVMGGVELVEAMRRTPELASLPIVISTSAPHLAPAGVPVVAKPVDIEAIWSWVRKSCDCPGAST